MKHKQYLVRVLFICVFCISIVFGLTGCVNVGPNDAAYWFSENSYKFVEYDEAKNNINEAGSYWNFTSAKNEDITLSVVVNVDNFYSAAYLYVNDVQVKSETNTGIFTYTYNLSLKKGDTIKLHAFWTNSIMYDEKGFEILSFVISQNGQMYPIKEFDKTTLK